MKKNVVILGLCLAVLSTLSASNRNFGFKGKIQEGMEVEINAMTAPIFVGTEEFDAESSKVLPIAIGVKKHVRPVNPLNPNFLYYAYYLLTIDEWWVGCIVVNFDNVDKTVDLTMTMIGPQNSSITDTIVVKKNTAKIFTAKIEPAEYAGLYSLVGKVSGDGIKVRKVNTRFFIYDVL